MQTKDQILENIRVLAGKIQKDKSMTGSAIDKYDSTHIWDLGDQITSYGKVTGNPQAAIAQILYYLQKKSISIQATLLKKAETARRAFPTRAEYLRLAEGISYGKLREVLTIYDPDFSKELDVSTNDLDALRISVSKMTYEEVRSRIRSIREKYDPEGENVDFDELWEEISSAIEELTEMIEQKDQSRISNFRSQMDMDFISESRKLMAALSNEQMFLKLNRQLPSRFGLDLTLSEDSLRGQIHRVLHDLAMIRNESSEKRDKLRQRIGISMIGELSTLMKAATSDEEMSRYLRGRSIIQKLQI